MQWGLCLRYILPQCCRFCSRYRLVEIVAITTGVEGTYIKGICRGFVTFFACFVMFVLRVYLYKGVIGGEDIFFIFGVFKVLVVKGVNSHCKWLVGRSSDGTRNIVTAIHLIDDDATGIGVLAGILGIIPVLTIDMYECASAHISHSGTTKHAVNITTLYGYRSLPVDISLVTATIYVATNLLPVNG